MLSVVSSRLDGVNSANPQAISALRNGIGAFGKVTRPSTAACTRCCRAKFMSSWVTKRKAHFSANAQSDITEDAQSNERDLGPKEGAELAEISGSHQNNAEETEEMASKEKEKMVATAPVRKPKEKDAMKLPFEIGDRVTVTVSGLQRMGAFVTLDDYSNIKGYLPTSLFPLRMMPQVYKEVEEPPTRTIYNNLKRRAYVIRRTRSFVDGFAGPMFNMYKMDRATLLRRLQVLQELCVKEHETVKGYILARNDGGLVVAVAGFQAFMPRALMTPEVKSFMRLTDEEFAKKHIGTDVEVSVMSVDVGRNRTIVSTKDVTDTNVLKRLKIGTLIEGRVQGFTKYGVFVTIAGTTTNGLLHVRNISGKIVRVPENIFTIGDTVYAVVMDMNEDFSRIALSTADLEEFDGEILYDREKVMENAPAMAEKLQKELDEARRQYKESTENYKE